MLFRGYNSILGSVPLATDPNNRCPAMGSTARCYLFFGAVSACFFNHRPLYHWALHAWQREIKNRYLVQRRRRWTVLLFGSISEIVPEIGVFLHFANLQQIC